jgi:hypothetical protein
VLAATSTVNTLPARTAKLSMSTTLGNTRRALASVPDAYREPPPNG